MQQPRARVEHVHEPVGGARDEERVVHIPREQPPVRRRVRGRAPQRHGLRVVVARREQAEVVMARTEKVSLSTGRLKVCLRMGSGIDGSWRCENVNARL